MRQIITKQQAEEKARRKKTIVGIVLVGLMLLSTAGYAFFSGERQSTSSETKISYNEIKFNLLSDQLWHFYIDSKEYATSFNPKQTENISITGKFNASEYSGKTVYFSSDSSIEGVNEILNNLGSTIKRTQYACLEDNCTEDWPVKSCSTDNIIILQTAEKSSVKKVANCVYIMSTENETLKASDAFIFKSLGVI